MTKAKPKEDNPPQCFNCTLIVEKNVYIKCAECSTIICALCFQCGAEGGKHKRGHNYQVIDPQGVTCSQGRWGYEEEVLLLRAAHLFKMGNWGEIREHVGDVVHSSNEIRDYFEKTFIRGWLGQFAIKSADWDRIKYEMYKNRTLESVLTQNACESTERLLMIRDALLECNVKFEMTDPKLAQKIQTMLEAYVEKCVNGTIEIKYERAKHLPNQFETEISNDDYDPTSDFEIPKKTRGEVSQDEESDSPAPVRSSKRSPPPKKRRTRVMRESSTDSEQDADNKLQKSMASNNSYHGMEREMEEDDANDSACDTAMECDSDDEEAEKKPKKAIANGKRKKKKKPQFSSKKQRRLIAFSNKMSRSTKKSQIGLEKICSLDEMKELRNAFPRMILENGSTVKAEKSKFRQSDLQMIGYNVDREEFDTEWFNDAEQLISRLQITPSTPEKNEKLDIENDIKFARVRQYIRIMGMRKAKRNAIIEHNKINEYFQFLRNMTIEKRLATEVVADRTEKEEIIEMTQQFLTKDEYKALNDSIEKVDALKERIEALQKLQRDALQAKQLSKMRPLPSSGRNRRKSERSTTK